MNHPKISELLPWYVNGTLDTGDRQAAALEVASCDECAREMDDLTRVQAAMLELDAEMPEPAESGFARALAAVEEEEQRKRLGHPWFGWWWALTPFRRAIAVSAALGVAVLAAFVAVPKHVAEVPIGASAQSGTPLVFESTANTVAVNADQLSAKSAAGPASAAAGAPANAAPATETSTGVQLARSGGVSLLVPDVESAISGLMAIARAQSGAVLSLEDQTPAIAGDRHTAHLDLLVPESRFDSTVAMVAKIGGVQSRTIDAANVGGQIVDSEARLRNLRRAEADYLKIMDRAGKIDDVLAVENQVSATREQIEELDGQVAALKHQVAFANVSIELSDEAAAATVEVSPLAQLRSTWLSALHSVGAVTIALIGGLLWGFAYLPYAIVLAVIGGLVSMRFRRP